ncbi:hypothetical protein [Holospora obtusa]|uniref:hypothetical protein n=1 Tax=Holospora obtusa TaxID=49893 RepID=UPI00058BD302|nr:hypothetical protein [Holospora obtusa]
MTGMLSLKFYKKTAIVLENQALYTYNSHTRHHLGRMTRRTKVLSKKEFYGVQINQALVCAYDIRNF